jgi:integrase/recombinase XerD
MPLKLIQRAGSENFYIRGTVRGQSVFESTGTGDRKVAEEIRIKTEARLLKESVHGKTATVTFTEAAKSYIASGGSTKYLLKQNKKTGEVTGVAMRLRGKLLKDITQSDLDQGAAALYPNANAETRNRQFFTPFIAVWNHSVLNQWAAPRQWRRPRKPKGTNIAVLKRPRAGTRPTSYDRASTFIAEMSPAAAQIMTVLFYTGMRPIELFTLEKAQVDVAGRWISLDKSKTGEPRGVPMHEFLEPLFRSLMEVRKSVLFLSHKGEPYPPSDEFGGQISGAIEGARKRLAKRGIEIVDIAAYTGRHTASTQLVINGVHPYIKDQILGHAADDMSRHYTNVPQAPLIEAINTLPVPQAWRDLWWWEDPAYWSRRLIGAKNKAKVAAKSA